MIRTGTAADPVGKEGLAAFTASLLKKGAGSRDAADIAETIEFHGGMMNVDYNHDATFVSGSFLSRDVELSLELMADMMRRPVFSEEEIERQRTQMLGMIDRARERAGYLTSTFYTRFLYGAHPYSRPGIGNEASLRQIVKSDLVAFHRTFYVPSNAFLVIVGDIDAGAVLSRIERAFGKWSGSPVSPVVYPPITDLNERRVRLVNKPDITQAHIRIGAIGITRKHPDYIPILVANTILGGGGFSSRLVDEIRVNRGLTYDITSRFTTRMDRGTFTIATFTKTETTGALIEAILEELNKFRDDGVVESEVNASRQYIAGSFPLGLEGPEALAIQFSGIELFGMPGDFLQTYRRKVRSVSKDDVMDMMNRYFSSEALAIVILGNADLIRPQVEQFGPVEQIEYKD